MVEIELNGAGNSPGTAPAAAHGISGGARGEARRDGGTLFPVGIFFLLFFIESIMALGATGAYFLYAGAGRITEIEADTRSHAVTLADALGSAAELSYRAKDYARLRKLFREKMRERTIDKAFFILKSGKLVAHTDPTADERLQGNLGSEGSPYNLDLILKPVREASADAFFTDYERTSGPVPFDRGQRDLIRQYLYGGIDAGGWLASRAVYGKKKPVGAVGVIVSKTRIHAFIRDHTERTLQILRVALAAAFAVSLVVTLAVFMRYRVIRKRALAERRRAVPEALDELYDMSIAVVPAGDSERAIPIELGDLVGERGSEAVFAIDAADRGTGRKIKDAVPADGKE